MIRSMAASMAPSGSCRVWELRSGNRFGLGLRLEPDDGLVGQPDLVEFAVLEQLDDDLEEAFVSDEGVPDRAGAAKIVRGDGIGLAHEFHVHDPHATLDQHRHPSDPKKISLEPGTRSLPLGIFFATAKWKNAPVRTQPGR